MRAMGGLMPTYHTTSPTAAVPSTAPHKRQQGMMGGVGLRFTGRKPAWDARQEPRYLLPGYTAEGIGEAGVALRGVRLRSSKHRWAWPQEGVQRVCVLMGRRSE